jgi:hypothetical protein
MDALEINCVLDTTGSHEETLPYREKCLNPYQKMQVVAKTGHNVTMLRRWGY